MRVAVVFPQANRRAGVERVAWDLSDYLAARHETTFVGLAMEERDANAAEFHPVRPGRLTPLSLAFGREAARALEGLRPDVALTLGAECHPGDVYWVQSVHRAFLSRSRGPTWRGGRIPAWTRRLLPRHQMILALERRYYSSPRPQTILCTSAQDLADLTTYYGVDARRCRVMPNGYDPAIFNTQRRAAERSAARSRLGLTDGDISVLFVANELHRKGFGALIEAFQQADIPAGRLDVVGRVAETNYRTRIERLGLSDRIRWHGSTNDVFRFYAAADVMVLPTQYEPFGIVIVEALASGLPVITSRLAGASSAVADGDNGRLLSDPTDVAELAGCLREVADPAVRNTWAGRAAAGAEPFGWPRIFAEVEEVLRNTVQSRQDAG
jgi:UDP-glucose:(heptosyl)LPS alpha-1,3-glucosyltransferase